MSFSKNFIFCTSTASYQVEGAWNLDGKGENIWDHLVHTTPDLVANKDNGDVACDSYHKYKEDVQLMKEIGVSRLSISWARILPTGDITNINNAGIEYYHNVIDELLHNGIDPMVTMFHWDLPQKLQEIGGWLNPLIVDYFEDFADLLFKHYGDKVPWWITINEPTSIIDGYDGGNLAPNLHLGSPANYIVAHNILLAHGRVYRLYEEKYRSVQKGKISISLCGGSSAPKTNSKDDEEAAERVFLFEMGWFSDPIYSKNGDYPEIMKKTVEENSKSEGRNRSRLPSFTAEEINLIRGSFDFFALNHYTTRLCSPGAPPYNSLYAKDVNVRMEYDPKWPGSKASWLKVVPWGLKLHLIRLKDRYNNVPVFITENGYCDTGELQDDQRISYYRSYLEEIEKAMKEHGCNVIGYTAWSILDNFEWLDGYENRFGLVHVDFNDPERKRTPKASSKFFQQLIKTRTIPK